MAEKKIEITCSGSAFLEINELEELQGNLKELPRKNFLKLRKSILKYGFSFPVFCWHDEKENKNFIIDAHQRMTVLKMLKADGYTIPKLPVCFIEAKDKSEAKKKLLQFNSSYGKITTDGLIEFVMDIPEFSVNSIVDDMNISLDFNKTVFAAFGGTTKKNINAPPESEEEVSEEEKKLSVVEWLQNKEKIFLQFSGGKDSMALVAWVLENNIDKEKIRVVFNMTPYDYDDMNAFVENFCKKENLALDIVDPYNGDEEKFKNELMFFGPVSGFSNRWCTDRFKIRPFKKYIKDHGIVGNKNAVVLQGWRRDEGENRAGALMRSYNKKNDIYMCRPILDYSLIDVFRVIEKMGWELHPSYKYSERLGCIYCFAKSRSDWNKMRERDPKVFLRALMLVAEGFTSEFIDESKAKNIIRKMMGLGPIAFCKKKIQALDDTEIETDESLMPGVIKQTDETEGKKNL